MLYNTEYFQRGQSVDLHDAFTQWYSQRVPHHDFRGCYLFGDAHLLNPRVFTEFLRDMRQQFCGACRESLVEQYPMTFGGADGGGGLVYTGVEAEHLDQALHVPQHATVVAPFTHDAYMNVLTNRIRDKLPRPALMLPEVGDHGTVLHVQSEFRHLVAEDIVPRRPYLQSNIECVDALTKRQYDALVEYAHDEVHDSHLVTS